MLGRLKVERRWQWSASGKHPVAKDFFAIGADFPLARAFSEWVGRGYDALAPLGRSGSTHALWRFWTREARKDHVVCGILRDSRDALGRRYPLLIMGSGPLPDWDKNWDLVPYAYENVWAQMECLSTKSVADLTTLGTEIQEIKPPGADWGALLTQRKHFDDAFLAGLGERLHRLSEADPFLCLDGQPYDALDLAGICHHASREEAKSPPNTVFMGGTGQHTYFAVFRRALSTSDFATLWSVDQRQ
jgi:type VI secretion system protein VasJ